MMNTVLNNKRHKKSKAKEKNTPSHKAPVGVSSAPNTTDASTKPDQGGITKTTESPQKSS